MAGIDYGILMYKNGNLISERFSEECFVINGHQLVIDWRGTYVQYDNQILYQNTFDKVEQTQQYNLNGNYILIKPIRHKYNANYSNVTYIYMRTIDNDIYQGFAGFGIDYQWWKYTKSYDYSSWLINKLNQIDKRRYKL